MTPKTLPFVEAFKKKFGNFPSYAGYTAYDEVYYIADAIKRAGSTDPDKLVDGAGEDRLGRHHRPHPVLRQGRPIHPRR